MQGENCLCCCNEVSRLEGPPRRGYLSWKAEILPIKDIKSVDHILCILTSKYYTQSEASRGEGAQSVPVNRLVVGLNPIRGVEIFIYIYILISSLWCRRKARR